MLASNHSVGHGKRDVQLCSSSDLIVKIQTLAEQLKLNCTVKKEKDIVLALKDISDEHQIEVGTYALIALIAALKCYHQSSDQTLGCILATLGNILCPSEAADCPEAKAQFMQTFLEQQENTVRIVKAFCCKSLTVKLPAVNLLTSLLAHSPDVTLRLLSEICSGKEFVDLIDVLRSCSSTVQDQIISFIVQVVRGNSGLVQLMTSQGIISKLLDKVSTEYHSHCDAVVLHYFEILLELLDHCEESHIYNNGGTELLLSLLKSIQPPPWQDIKTEILNDVLKVVRALVSPASFTDKVKILERDGGFSEILTELCRIADMQALPASTLKQLFCAVGEIVCARAGKQQLLDNVLATSNLCQGDPLIFLFKNIFNKYHSVSVRAAALFCFKCYLNRNADNQNRFVNCIVSMGSTCGLGRDVMVCYMLRSGFKSQDSTCLWFSTSVLSCALIDNLRNKELILDMKLSLGSASEPISLLEIIVNTLEEDLEDRAKVGLLSLLTVLLAECSRAVVDFLKLPKSFSVFKSQLVSPQPNESEMTLKAMAAFVLGLCVTFIGAGDSHITKGMVLEWINAEVGAGNVIANIEHLSESRPFEETLGKPESDGTDSIHFGPSFEYCCVLKKFKLAVVSELHCSLSSCR